MSTGRGASRLGVLAVTGVLAAGCGSKPPPPPPPTVVDLTFSATNDVNPDPSGRASPIIVRYYQLGAPNAFERADFFQLYDKDTALLGPDLIDRQQLAVGPGVSQKVSFEAKPNTKFVGVIASYRDIDQAVWRADAPVPPNKTTKLKVQLDKLKLALVPEEPEK